MIQDFFLTYFGWQAQLALFFGVLTLSATLLMNKDRRESISLWLLGAQNQDEWAQTFRSFFTSIFGTRHFSMKCFAFSSIFSMIFICIVFFSAQTLGLTTERFSNDVSLLRVLFIALCINLAADYFSLLETRIILKSMSARAIQQISLLLLDIVLSALIIITVIWLYRQTPLRDLEFLTPDGLADTVLSGRTVEKIQISNRLNPGDNFFQVLSELISFHSFYSIFFYSTFIASLWIWLYFVGSLVMRISSAKMISDNLDIETKPAAILSLLVTVVAYGLFWSLSPLISKGNDNLTTLEHYLCDTFKGRICSKIADISTDEPTQNDLRVIACEGGDNTMFCNDRGLELLFSEPVSAVRYLRAACDGGHDSSCVDLAYMYFSGRLGEANYAIAADLFKASCASLNPASCEWFAYLLSSGKIPDETRYAAYDYYQAACDLESKSGCYQLAILIQEENSSDASIEAVKLLESLCNEGQGHACLKINEYSATNAEFEAAKERSFESITSKCLDSQDIEPCHYAGWYANTMSMEFSVGASLLQSFEEKCQSGNQWEKGSICYYVGLLYFQGILRDQNKEDSIDWFVASCDSSNSESCVTVGYLSEEFPSAESNAHDQRYYFDRACDLQNMRGCSSLGRILEAELGIADTEVIDLYRKSCRAGDALGCRQLGDLAINDIDVLGDWDSFHFFSIACEYGHLLACSRVDRLLPDLD